MNHLRPLAVAAALVLPAVSLAQTTRPADAEVPVRRVTLFASGVGAFTHAGTVTGDSEATLRFPAGQVNDLLKSLTLTDLGGGRVGTVTFPSADPLGKTLGSFRLDLRGQPDLAEILRQLRGAEVTVQLTGEQVNGTVLGVEEKMRPVGEGGEPVPVVYLNLFTGTALRSVALDEVRGITIADEALREDLRRALAAVAEAAGNDKKAISLDFSGEGEREVRFAYVVQQPIWKASYRLVLGEEGSADVQGWAIVENQTDFDWDGVQLSLVSGRPISFEMDLYEPLYVDRPDVPVPTYAAVAPQSYAGGVEREETVALGTAVAEGRPLRAARAASPASPAADMAEPEAVGEAMAFYNQGAGVAAAASGGEAGALFEFTVPGVTLARQSGAMIPIVVGEVEAEPISIYNQSVLADHPLRGAEVTNTTDSHLPPGPVTVFDGNDYQGDARLVDTPPGEDRLLSFGVDQEVTADVTTTGDQSITAGRIVQGVLELTRLNRQTTTYVFDNDADEAKDLLLEHPRRDGWELADTPDPAERTDAVYRFELDVPAEKTGEFAVKLEQTVSQDLAVLDLDLDTLARLSQTGAIRQEVRDALASVAEKKRTVARLEDQIEQVNGQIDRIAAEQDRIRQNMKAVGEQSELFNRLARKLDEQETTIEELQGRRQELQEERDAKQRELEQAVLKLKA